MSDTTETATTDVIELAGSTESTELTEESLAVGMVQAINDVLNAYLQANTDIDPSLHGIPLTQLDRLAADRLTKQELDNNTSVSGKTGILSKFVNLQRARRDLGIIRMTTQQRILAALSGMNMHISDLNLRAGTGA